MRVALIMLTVLLASCGSSNQPSNNNQAVLKTITLEDEGPVSDCEARQLDNKILVLESKYCGACKVAVPRLKEIEQELQQEFIFLDLSKREDAAKLDEFKVVPHYTPTVIVGCDVLIGVKEKEEYKQIIEEFLGV